MAAAAVCTATCPEPRFAPSRRHMQPPDFISLAACGWFASSATVSSCTEVKCGSLWDAGSRVLVCTVYMLCINIYIAYWPEVRCRVCVLLTLLAGSGLHYAALVK